MRGRLFPELAILPDVFDPSNFDSAEAHRVALSGLRQVLERQGLVRDLQRGESSAFREGFERSNGSLNARAFLQFLAKRGLCVRLPSCNGKDWADEARLSHRQRPLSAVVTDELTDLRDEDLHAAALTDLLDMPWISEWVVSVQIASCPRDFAECFDPILRFGRVVHLIDPYFKMGEERCKRVLVAMLQRARQSARQSGSKAKFHVHLSWDLISTKSRPEGWDDEAQLWWNEYRRLVSRHGLLGEMHFWDPDVVRDGFHARCILCEFAGCSCDRSFQDLRGKVSVVSLLSPEDRGKILRRFNPHPNSSVGLVKSFR